MSSIEKSEVKREYSIETIERPGSAVATQRTQTRTDGFLGDAGLWMPDQRIQSRVRVV